MWNGDFMETVSKFIQGVKIWNKNIFGNVFHRKNNILAQLHSIDHILDYRDSKRLQLRKNTLALEYEEVLAQEEIIWFQKSRKL